MKKLNRLMTFALLVASAVAFVAPTKASTTVHHQGNKTYVVKNGKRYYTASVSTKQAQRNTGINKTLSPNLSCGSEERNNHVTKGATYGAGAGLLLGGGLVGGAVGAGAGALVQQEQNRDACRGKK